MSQPRGPQSEETKKKISNSFWNGIRPGSSRLPPHIARQIKYLYENEPTRVSYRDLARALRVSYETIRLIRNGYSWKGVEPMPLTPDFQAFLNRIQEVTTSIEFYTANHIKRETMVHDATDELLKKIIRVS